MKVWGSIVLWWLQNIPANLINAKLISLKLKHSCKEIFLALVFASKTQD